MNIQFYENTFNSFTYINLTNIYPNLLIINKSNVTVSVFYRETKICEVEGQTYLSLENVFTQGKQFDENAQLKIVSGYPNTYLQIINYGKLQNDKQY